MLARSSMTKQQQFMARVKEVTEFCMKQTPYCFGCWPVQTIFLYVGFAAWTGCIFVKRNHGKICAVAFAFPEDSKRLLQRNEEGLPSFQWSLPKEADSLLIREVVGNRSICSEFWAQANRQWPALKRCFTFRTTPKLTLVELNEKVMNRFYGFKMKGAA